LVPSHVYLIGIEAFAANADDVRLNVIGLVAEPLSPRGRPTLVTTAAVSVFDELDFPQAAASERRAIVRKLRSGISAILSIEFGDLEAILCANEQSS
jgi:hypothetical protein